MTFGIGRQKLLTTTTRFRHFVLPLTTKRRRALLPLAALALLARCGDSAPAADRAFAGGAGFPGGGAFDASAGGGAGSGGGPGVPPPEKEVESSFRSPVAVGRFVWAANPESGRVARVDATTLEVKTAEAGFGPTYLAALPTPGDPEASRAVVINVLSHDATLLTSAPSGGIDTVSVDVHVDANAWAISAGAHWAIAWSNAELVQNPDPTDGFQDITVIDLSKAPPVATRLSVGYRPARIFVSGDEKRAFAVTEPGVSVIELDAPGGPTVSRDVAVSDDPLDNPASRDVSITPDGAYALVRRDGSREVGVVSLATGEIVSIELGGAVTDLDLSEDGTQAIAVVREPAQMVDAGSNGSLDGSATDGAPASDSATPLDDGALGEGGDATPPADAAPDTVVIEAGPRQPTNSEVSILPIPGIASNPDDFQTVAIAGETAGSVSWSPDSKVALLYSNATANDHLTILVTAPGPSFLTYRTVALKAPVLAVFPAPDAEHAVALLTPGAGSSKIGAFSIVPIKTQLPPKIEGTEAAPMSVAFAPPPSRRALITVRDDTKRIFGAYLARMPELQVDRFELRSPPLAAGVVGAANAGYVAQQHPEGRITFIDLAAGTFRTLTGFELGTKVIDGTQP
jgi:hypothetical protein